MTLMLCPIVFWRGADFGPVVRTMHELPRIRLCRLGIGHPDLFDVGIAAFRHGRFTDAITAAGYRAHIDIDGRSNAWSGLFQKLLTGSPLLKVASPAGYRQWYYDALEPWINYVPVMSDMSDLVEKARWVLTHDEAAHRIGRQGQALAMSLSYEGEIDRAARTIAGAFRYFADPA
jgi:Glycosyl transferase family 90